MSEILEAVSRLISLLPTRRYGQSNVLEGDAYLRRLRARCVLNWKCLESQAESKANAWNRAKKSLAKK